MENIRSRRWPLLLLLSWVVAAPAFAKEPYGEPVLYKRLEVPRALLAGGEFMGDLRVGDLTGDGRPDFVIYQSADDGMKPCFLAALDLEGRVLWQHGGRGGQPARPGSVAVYDVTGDGRDEIVCLFVDDPQVRGSGNDMRNTVLQLRDGRTGRVLRQNAPEPLRRATGEGANWVHQRIQVANFRGTDRPRDFLIKLGTTLLAFDDRLQPLWTYEIDQRWSGYGRHSAYIPAVGDLTGDGRDEVNGGYYILNPDGTPRWAGEIGPHMDSVAITEWDSGRTRAIASGAGHVLDADGNVVLRLGENIVPHGQEVRVANFLPDSAGPEMILRYRGHQPDVITVANDGTILHRFRLNHSPNHTGMEAVYWAGADRPALLYNGGVLWHGEGRRFADLPGLHHPIGPRRRGWYHCIPVPAGADTREGLVVYNPCDRYMWLYVPAPACAEPFTRYRSTARQYNVRLMD